MLANGQMTSDQQISVRDTKKVAKSCKRAIKAAATGPTKEVSNKEREDDTSENAGYKFGRNAHEKGKKGLRQVSSGRPLSQCQD